jgi:transposase
MNKRTTIAVDIAKNVFEIAVSEVPGRVSARKRLSRSKLLAFFAEQAPATVVLEACGMAHHWGRKLLGLGHDVVLLPPNRVRPYVSRNKTDRTDAKGLLEAHRNEELRPVPIKSPDQQAIMALHRMRSAWLATRTARINTVRGILRELGLVIPQGAKKVVPRTLELLALPQISPRLEPVLVAACEEIRELETRITDTERQLEALARQVPLVERLRSIPGIGLLTATALVAFVTDIHRFATSRHFASYFGLTPKEHSSGQRRRMGRISKQGNAYLRTLLIHGSRSVLRAAKLTSGKDRVKSWALALEERRGHNKAAAALANKLARISWALWAHDTTYQPTYQHQAR